MQDRGKHEGPVCQDRRNDHGSDGDLGALINSIYNALRDHNPEAAEFFADKFPQVLEKFKDDVFGPDIFKSVAIGTVTKKRKEEAADD